eukprot:TRINITY_DN108580_c0_g1_i1.p1 TRINITY_DN108580_c0_g1~~TRINITY_DN108580_c0_g1_i1.p1  ORF type:complete len:136 (+),score=9.98 TRINITY_DN108580_c0_g1_i1:36-443(+)
MDADWTVVTLKKTDKQKTSGMSQAQAIGSLKASGSITTEKKFAAGENKNTGSSNLKKIDDSTDEYKHNTVDKNLRMAISQARQAKKMTQKDLAKAINESAQVIQQYEAGTAIPNPQVLNKLDRALGVHLPRNKKK